MRWRRMRLHPSLLSSFLFAVDGVRSRGNLPLEMNGESNTHTQNRFLPFPSCCLFCCLSLFICLFFTFHSLTYRATKIDIINTYAKQEVQKKYYNMYTFTLGKCDMA